ncbi:MAG: hypothetical protein R3B45_09855 [Bdellovibrionota bacterium]
MLRNSQIRYKIASSIIIAVFLINCSRVGGIQNPKRHSSIDSSKKKGDTFELSELEPTQSYYDGIMTANLLELEQPSNSNELKPYYLNINFSGSTLNQGTLIGESPLVCNEKQKVPASDLSESVKEELMASIKDFFSKDKLLNLQIISEKEPQNPIMTTTINVASSYKDLGCEKAMPYPGIAINDKNNDNTFDQAFIFLKSSGNETAEIANAILITFAQSLGLEADTTEEISSADLFELFGKVEEKQPQPKNSVGELPTENPAYEEGYEEVEDTNPIHSVFKKATKEQQKLPGLEFLAGIAEGLVGVDDASAISTSSINPAIQSTIPQNIKTPGINRVITIIELSKLAAKKKAAEENLPTDEDKLNALAKGLLKPSSLANMGMLAAMASVGGFASIPAAMGAASEVYKNVQEEIPENQDPNAFHLPSEASILPDFSAYMELSQITELKELIHNMYAHADLIQKNFKGKDRDALLSLIKLAYSQAYTQNLR